jgi:carbonic anhydrase/acetyltransferase-like protein (isoleucine patch superfamily)
LSAEDRLSTILDIHPDAWIAPGAVLAGRVRVGAGSSIWYGCVVRGDLEPVRIGAWTNVQDLTVVHVDRGQPVSIGDWVTIGHRAVIHGCTVEDEALIGMGAVLLSGCRIGRGAVVAAGAVVLEGFEVPAGSIAAGLPARLRTERVGDELRRRIRAGAEGYVRLARAYRAAQPNQADGHFRSERKP